MKWMPQYDLSASVSEHSNKILNKKVVKNWWRNYCQQQHWLWWCFLNCMLIHNDKAFVKSSRGFCIYALCAAQELTLHRISFHGIIENFLWWKYLRIAHRIRCGGIQSSRKNEMNILFIRWQRPLNVLKASRAQANALRRGSTNFGF